MARVKWTIQRDDRRSHRYRGAGGRRGQVGGRQGLQRGKRSYQHNKDSGSEGPCAHVETESQEGVVNVTGDGLEVTGWYYIEGSSP